MKIYSGFTLAETLLTIGIIGIIATITIPTLKASTSKATYLSAIRSTYNVTDQAITQKLSDEHVETLAEAGITSQDATNIWAQSYFKIAQTCTGSDLAPCFAPVSQYNKIKGKTSSSPLLISTTTSYVLENGVSIRPLYIGINKGKNKTDRIINFLIDTNGQKGPNIYGRDLMGFAIYNNGVIDDLYDDDNQSVPLTIDKRNSKYTSGCISHSNEAWGCFGKILNDNWQMNY